MLALASGWLGPAGRADLAKAAEAARGLGFSRVHATRPPKDAATVRPVLDRLGLSLEGISTAPVKSLAEVDGALARAAKAAADLRESLVVLDVGGLKVGPKETPEAAVLALARDLHGAGSTFSGLSIAVRGAARGDGLLGMVEVEWLLDALKGKAVGLWLDPARATALQRAKRPGNALDWADRLAKRTMGVALHGLGPAGEGHALPEDDGADWGTLRGLLSARVPRVLDVGPAVPAGEVADARRKFEEFFHW